MHFLDHIACRSVLTLRTRRTKMALARERANSLTESPHPLFFGEKLRTVELAWDHTYAVKLTELILTRTSMHSPSKLNSEQRKISGM